MWVFQLGLISGVMVGLELKFLEEDAPYIFLFYNKTWSGQNNRIQGIEPTALGIGWNFEDWYVEEPVE